MIPEDSKRFYQTIHVPAQMEPSPGFSPPCAWGPFSCTTDSLLVEDLLKKPELLSQISRGKRLSIIYTLYTLRLMQIPRPSSLLCWKLLRRHEAHKLFPSLPAFSIFWMVTKRPVFANLTNQPSLSALLSSCPSHQCHICHCSPSQSQVDWKCLTNFCILWINW